MLWFFLLVLVVSFVWMGTRLRQTAGRARWQGPKLPVSVSNADPSEIEFVDDLRFEWIPEYYTSTTLQALRHQGQVWEGEPERAPQYGNEGDGYWRSIEYESGEEVWSEIGQVPPDGGRFKDFLIEFRQIIEGKSSTIEKIQAAERLCKSSGIYTSFADLIGSNFPYSWFAVQLTVLPSVGPGTAQKLFDAGFIDLASVRTATDEDLTAIHGMGVGKVAAIRKYFASKPTKGVSTTFRGQPRLSSGLLDNTPGESKVARDPGKLVYVALDVETANSDCSSICQVGIAEFGSDRAVGRTWVSLIDPEDYFDWMNVSIHGINQEAVQGAPRFPDVLPEICELCNDRIVVHHMPFDRVAIIRAAQRYGLSEPRAMWLDSARVARRAWERFSQRGYGLKNLASELKIPLQHHDALSDAIAAGSVVALAIEKSDMDISEWLHRIRQPLAGSPSASRRGNPAGYLVGEKIVFTGALTMPRRRAADLAAAAGADVAGAVSNRTTLLVVGMQDLRRTRGQDKSSKHRKAEALVSKGANISIIGEEDFLELVAPMQ